MKKPLAEDARCVCSRRALAVASALLLTMACSGPTDGAPASETGGAPATTGAWTPGECAWLATYRELTSGADGRNAATGTVLGELTRIPPVGWIEGFWVTPLDVRGVEFMHGRPRLGLAFTGASLRGAAGLPFVGKLERVDAEATGSSGVFVVPVRDVQGVLIEYVPPRGADEDSCYFFCGNPAGWDFDADGEPNDADDDDDGDGVPDGRDAFPYAPEASACDCGDRAFTGVTGKFSVEVSTSVLAAFDVLKRGPELLRLGSHEGGGFDVWLALPGETGCVKPAPDRPAAVPESETDPAHSADPPTDSADAESSCPDADDPGVRYVSRDSDDCARLRFFCDPGWTPFSDNCGCGCVSEERP